MARDKKQEQADNQFEEKAAADAVALFGPEAAIAVAYCGLDAWFEGQQEESRRWGKVLRRLAN
ncbi:MAG: hypothetical protein ACK4N1_13030 [Pseudorhizobium sp.]